MNMHTRWSPLVLSSYFGALSLLFAGAASARPSKPADPLAGVSQIRSEKHAAELMEEVHAQRRAQSKPQKLAVPYSALDPETDASLWLLGMFVDPIEVSVTALNRIGGRFPLGTFELNPHSFLEIDLTDALAPAKSRGPWQEGALHVEYFGDPGMVAGWLVMKGSGGVFEVNLTHLNSLTGSSFTSFWDRSDPLAYLTPVYQLHNASERPIQVSLRIGSGEKTQDLAGRVLVPGATTSFRPPAEAGWVRGWVEISHDSEPGSLLVGGRLEGSGFVSRLPVVQDFSAVEARAYETIRVPLSNPQGEPVFPVVAMFNPTQSAQTVKLSWLERTTGSVLAELKRTVPAREVLGLDSVELLTAIPLPVPEEARLRVEAEPSGVVVWGIAIPRVGPPLDLALFSLAKAHATGMYPLPGLEGRDVFTTLTNLGTEPAEVVAQITWNEGSYALGPVVIPAGGSQRLDFRQIAKEGPPDLLGRTLDPEFESGYFQWLSHGGSTHLIARTEVRPRDQDGGDAFGFNCLTCCVEVPFGELIPGSATFPVGQSPLFQTTLGYNTCTGTLGPYFVEADTLDYPTPFSWDGVRISASGPGAGTASFLGSELGMSLLCTAILFIITDEGPVEADPVCEIKAPSSVKVGEPPVAFQTEVKPSGTVSNWRLTEGDPVCTLLDMANGKIGARTVTSAKAQMTCTINGQEIDSNEFDVDGVPAPQFVNVTWTSGANQILAQAFPNSADQTAVRSRVTTNLASIFAGSNVRFASAPSQGVTRITTLQILGDGTGRQGGEASYDVLNLSRANSGSIFIGQGSLNLASSSDPSTFSPINERRVPDRVADAIARLAAHEIAHMLGLVPLSTELTGSFLGKIAACHGVAELALNGSSSHHNPTSTQSLIMAPAADLSQLTTWTRSLYAFRSVNQTYLQRVLP